MQILSQKLKACSDEELMESIKVGEEAAFDDLYHRYSKRLLVYFYRMLRGNEEKAQDFLQDIFLKIIEKPHLFGSKSRFSNWIFTVANNMCKNEYRRLGVRDRVFNEKDLDVFPHSGENNRLENHLDESEFKEALLKELTKLDQVKQSTFLLRFQEDFSIREIGEILECSEGTVKSRLFYTTKHLARKLKAFNPEISR